MPLWEAMLGAHEPVAKLLIDNGASLSFGDVAQFAVTAAELNNLKLLEQIVCCGGDVTCPDSSENTALHVAVSEDNLEIVKFLLAQGADTSKPDKHGWSPQDLADQQGNEEIKQLFESHKELRKETVLSIPEKVQVHHGVRFLGGLTPLGPRRRSCGDFHNPLFGMISAAVHNEEKSLVYPINNDNESASPSQARV